MVHVPSELLVIDREVSQVVLRKVLCLGIPLLRKRLNCFRTVLTICHRIQVLAYALFKVHKGQKRPCLFRWWSKDRRFEAVQLIGQFGLIPCRVIADVFTVRAEMVFEYVESGSIAASLLFA